MTFVKHFPDLKSYLYLKLLCSAHYSYRSKYRLGNRYVQTKVLNLLRLLR